jgi:hypothetical protein
VQFIWAPFLPFPRPSKSKLTHVRTYPEPLPGHERYPVSEPTAGLCGEVASNRNYVPSLWLAGAFLPVNRCFFAVALDASRVEFKMPQSLRVLEHRQLRSRVNISFIQRTEILPSFLGDMVINGSLIHCVSVCEEIIRLSCPYQLRSWNTSTKAPKQFQEPVGEARILEVDGGAKHCSLSLHPVGIAKLKMAVSPEIGRYRVQSGALQRPENFRSCGPFHPGRYVLNIHLREWREWSHWASNANTDNRKTEY